jgi:hypothetical protein
VIITRDADEASDLAAERLAAVIVAHQRPVLGFATGSTPGTAYRSLSRRVREGMVEVGSLTGFALDEYVGLPEGYPESYRAVIDREVVGPLGLQPGAIAVPDDSPARFMRPRVRRQRPHGGMSPRDRSPAAAIATRGPAFASGQHEQIPNAAVRRGEVVPF